MNEYNFLEGSLSWPLQESTTYMDVKFVGAKFALQIFAKGSHLNVAPRNDLHYHGGKSVVGMRGNVVGLGFVLSPPGVLEGVRCPCPHSPSYGVGYLSPA